MTNKKNIIKVKLSNNLNNFLTDYFSHTNLIRVLKNNCFIAGGFPRSIARYEFIEKSKNFSCIKDYLENNQGDIDIFSNSLDNINKSLLLFTKGERYEAVKKIQNNYHSQISQDSCFSKVYNIPTNKFLKSNKKIDYYNLPVTIKFQFVNKFFHKNVESSFDNFDFTNCMYALTFSENSFYLTYNKEALEYDRKQELNLENSNSPLLGSRIIKYLSYRNVSSIADNKNNKDILNEFLYKTIICNWDDIYTENIPHILDPDTLRVPCLHSYLNLSKEQIVLFLGSIERTRSHRISGSYGIYANYTTTYDWALDQLSN